MSEFKWSLAKTQYEKGMDYLKTPLKKDLERYLGSVGYGNYNIDFTTKNYGDYVSLDYDVFLIGEDDGYSEPGREIPYSYKDGGSIMKSTSFEEISLDEFKIKAEKEILDYIAGLN